jgi:hypothetical protein
MAGLAVGLCATAAGAQGMNQPGYSQPMTGQQQTQQPGLQPGQPLDQQQRQQQQAAQQQIPPFPGANSFTEDQARNRIAEAGFQDVGALRLDDKGIWRGTAQKEGQQMQVALDYQGNIVQMQ